MEDGNEKCVSKVQSTGTLSSVLDKVSFVKKIPLLSKATSDDENPTPGYMYQEINKISFASGSYCQALLDYLVDRLDKDSYHVKLKVLRILHFVVQYGHPDFRHGLRRRSRGIKEASKFSGVPDPLHGNVPYQMVRKAAQELSTQLFEVADNDMDVPRSQAAVIKSTVGMGSSSTGGGKMEGFGSSPSMPPKTLGSSLVSSIRGLADRVVDYSRNPQVTLDDPPNQHFGSYSPAKLELDPCGNVTSTATQENVSHLVGSSPKIFVPAGRVKSHRPGVAGGGWEDDEEDEEETATKLSFTKSSQSKSVSVGKCVTELPDENTADITNFEESNAEEQIVLEVMQDNNPIPPRSQVKKFMKKCCTLNCDKVLMVLNEQLLKCSPVRAMRGLICLEAFLRCDVVNLDYLAFTCRPALAHLHTGSHAPARSKTRKIIRLLEKLVQNPAILEGILPTVGPVESSHHPGNRICSTNVADQEDNCTRLQLNSEEEDTTWNQLQIPFANSSNLLINARESVPPSQSSYTEQAGVKDKDKLIFSS